MQTISIAWCDSSTVESPFIDGLLSVINCIQEKPNLNLISVSHQIGNEIFRQRQTILDNWFFKEKSDWLLCLDSDIVISSETFNILWSVADSITTPVISGIYFSLSYDVDGLPMPYPCVFKYYTFSQNYKSINPLPKNTLIQIDACGFGVLLLHRNVIKRLYEIYEEGNIFDVRLGEKAISEDLSFFEKLSFLQIPVYAHTNAFTTHIKKLNINTLYFDSWWKNHDQ